MTDALLHWTEEGQAKTARWRTERHAPPPVAVQPVDDRLGADAAYRLATAGTALLWRGDFQNARHLLQALGRRLDRREKPPKGSLLEIFRQQRRQQARRAELLGRLLIRIEADYRIALRRAPELAAACHEAWGPPDGEATLLSLRELQGLIGAHEWRRRGVVVPALDGERIHPHYGVFSPVRGEYLDLIASAPLDALPSPALAFDIGTGTGVIAALLARRGIGRVIATDMAPRALACARENLDRLGLGTRVEVVAADLFPPGTAPLVVCNPPWLPGEPSADLEGAIYDPGGRMLSGFLGGLAAHLDPGGEGWLILSDLAERIGLRGRDELAAQIAGAGLAVRERLDTRPRHGRAADTGDPLHAARAGEITSLWRLVRQTETGPAQVA